MLVYTEPRSVADGNTNSYLSYPFLMDDRSIDNGGWHSFLVLRKEMKEHCHGDLNQAFLTANLNSFDFNQICLS